MNEVGKIGRPTLYTPELGRDICMHVQHVGFEALAAELVGVHRHTVASWRQRGEAGEEPYVDFARELATAKATWARRELEKVDDPKWKLERADRALFAAAQKHELTGKDGRPIETVGASLTLTDAAADVLMRKALLGERGDDEGEGR